MKHLKVKVMKWFLSSEGWSYINGGKKKSKVVKDPMVVINSDGEIQIYPINKGLKYC